VTFDGIARACAAAAGAPSPELVHFSPKAFDFGKAKAFPMRDQHFFASVEKAKVELGWEPKFDLASGLKDSYEKDFGRGTFREAADFSARCGASGCVCSSPRPARSCGRHGACGAEEIGRCKLSPVSPFYPSLEARP